MTLASRATGLISRPSAHRFCGLRASHPSSSVIISFFNESGHIRTLVERLADLGPFSEFLFVEGGSKDDTELVI